MSVKMTSCPVFPFFHKSKRDTTDRSLVIESKEAGFDLLGFRNALGLQKDLFYYSPFLTCGYCNTIAFVDSASLRTSMIHGLQSVRDEREVR